MKKLMIIDEQTDFNLRKRPNEASEIRRNFEVVKNDELNSNLKNSLLRTSENKGISLMSGSNLGGVINANQNKTFALVQSPINQQCYYPLREFETSYKEDIFGVVYKLAAFMGAKKFKFDFVKQNYKSNLNQEDTRFGLGGNYKGFGGSMSYDSSSYYGYEEKRNYNEKFSHSSKNGITEKKSPEDLYRWISERNIIIYSLPKPFNHIVEIYLESGVIKGQGQYEKTEEIETHLIDSFNESMSLSLRLPTIFSLESSIDIGKQSEEKEKNYRYTFFEWDFGD